MVSAALLVLLSGCGGSDPAPDASGADSGSCHYPRTPDAARKVDLPPAEPARGEAADDHHQPWRDHHHARRRGRPRARSSSFVSLAKQGYFDDTRCHRLTTQGIYVLQCGDPTGTGSGGPGYTFDDELDRQGDLRRRHAGDGQRRAEHQRLAVLPGLRATRPLPPATRCSGRWTRPAVAWSPGSPRPAPATGAGRRPEAGRAHHVGAVAPADAAPLPAVRSSAPRRPRAPPARRGTVPLHADGVPRREQQVDDLGLRPLGGVVPVRQLEHLHPAHPRTRTPRTGRAGSSRSACQVRSRVRCTSCDRTAAGPPAACTTAPTRQAPVTGRS